MKHIAIILAGGVGKRMGIDMPKQFLEIQGKPVIAYTIENFQKNTSVDGVVTVCVKDYIPLMKDIVNKYHLDKVKWIIEGGDTSHDSTRNGIFLLEDIIDRDDYVIIHDAARPILPQAAIEDMLKVAHENGNASLAIPCHETVIYSDNQLFGDSQLDRSKLMRVQTPQAYRYDFILDLYKRAESEGKHDFIYADLVAIYYDKRVFFSKGFTNNIKITKREDIALCESLMKFTEDQLFSL